MSACTQVLKRSGSPSEKKCAERIMPVRAHAAARTGWRLARCHVLRRAAHTSLTAHSTRRPPRLAPPRHQLQARGALTPRTCWSRPQVIKNEHFLLVTLVLCNAAATEALPIFLDRLVDPFTAVLLSVSVVLVFGEHRLRCIASARPSPLALVPGPPLAAGSWVTRRCVRGRARPDPGGSVQQRGWPPPAPFPPPAAVPTHNPAAAALQARSCPRPCVPATVCRSARPAPG